jgi:hypothetical protein
MLIYRFILLGPFTAINSFRFGLAFSLLLMIILFFSFIFSVLCSIVGVSLITFLISIWLGVVGVVFT